MGIIHFEKKSDPQLLLKPGTLPGQCFAFKGTEGRIRIELSHKILITNVTMEHVPKILVKDTRSAPKRFQVIVYFFKFISYIKIIFAIVCRVCKRRKMLREKFWLVLSTTFMENHSKRLT